MLEQKRIRDFGITIGEMDPGAKNSITDIEGIKVGHTTVSHGSAQTGVTAIFPQDRNLFQNKITAAVHVINGFGKSMGQMQVEEMGVIETPILLTNTLSIGVASNVLIQYMLDQNKDIGDTTSTVNPMVFECNDAYLNDIRGSHIKPEHVMNALNNADSDFKEGSVGAATGMSCYKLKGGIGTASRRIKLGEEEGHLGALVMTNMGQKRDLTIAGKQIGQDIINTDGNDKQPDEGSIIIILATDLPLTERQLKRVAKRAIVGLSRTGSYIGNGSGEVVLAFTTKNSVSHYKQATIESFNRIHEKELDLLFRAAAESTEEAILNSMITAKRTTGRHGHTRSSLTEFAHLFDN